MKMGDKVRWVNANPEGWAGDGRAEIIGYDEARRYFSGNYEGDAKNPPNGPAVQIRLNNDKVTPVWVSPDELMPDLEAS